jgi:hypothetical protein
MATLQTLGLPDTRTPTQNSPPLKTSHTRADPCIYYRSTLIPTVPTYLQMPRLFPLCVQRFYRGRFLREHTALCARGNTGTGHIAPHSRGPVTPSISLWVPVGTRAPGISPSIPVAGYSEHIALGARGDTGTGHIALHSRGRLLRAYRSVCPWKHGHRAHRPPLQA